MKAGLSSPPFPTTASSFLRRSRGRRALRVFLAASCTFITTVGVGCGIFAQRPIQEMSDTVAALKAARELQCETLAPELYRQANEWFFKAKQEYKMKNFAVSKVAAEKARMFAEQAEFEALRAGGLRTEAVAIDPQAATPAAGGSEASQPQPKRSEPYAYPTPEAIPGEAVTATPPGPGKSAATPSGVPTP